MAIYKYKALNEKNHTVRGKLVAFSDSDAERKIDQRNLSPIWIADVTDSLYSRISFFLARIKAKDIVVFSREFSLLISSDVSIVESLLTILDQTDNLKLKNIIAEVAFEVDGGALLSDSLKKKGGKTFSDFYINVVKAGESSGKLDEVLNYLADEMEKDFDLTSKFRGAMIYPAFVLSGLVVVGMIMMLYVMPQLTSIIQETGATLPLATRMVIWTSNFIKDYIILIILFVIAVIVALRFMLATDFGRTRLDWFKLKVPVFGKIFKLVYLIRFCRSFSTLLYGGVTINRSLEVVSGVVRNNIYRDLINDTIDVVNEGHSVSYVFATSPFIPKMIPQMMVIGEKTGKLDDVLAKISSFYSRELNAKLNNLSVIIEPLVMVVMGAGVGIMVAAVILPMYNIATSF